MLGNFPIGCLKTGPYLMRYAACLSRGIVVPEYLKMWGSRHTSTSDGGGQRHMQETELFMAAPSLPFSYHEAHVSG